MTPYQLLQQGVILLHKALFLSVTIFHSSLLQSCKSVSHLSFHPRQPSLSFFSLSLVASIEIRISIECIVSCLSRSHLVKTDLNSWLQVDSRSLFHTFTRAQTPTTEHLRSCNLQCDTVGCLANKKRTRADGRGKKKTCF